jgi:hypothetical protein
MPMLLCGRRTTMGCVEILLSLDHLDPPEGTLRCVAVPGAPALSVGREIPFTGWLGMLRALSDILGSAGES